MGQHELIGDRGCDEADGLRDIADDHAVMMAADDAGHLPMARDEGTKFLMVAQINVVELFDPGQERRVMQRDHGLPLRLRGQGPLQPGGPRGAERTMRLAGDHTVQQHQTEGKILNGVLNKTFIVRPGR